MKILHLLHSFPRDIRGGTEAYVSSVAKAQASRGIRVAVVAWSGEFRDDRVVASRRNDGFPVHLLSSVWPAVEAAVEGRQAAVREAVLELLDEERPDVAHVHHWHGLTTDLVSTCGEAGVPAVVSLHDLFSTCPLFFRLPDDRNVCPPETPAATCASCASRFVGLGPARLEEDFRRRASRFRSELRSARRVLALSRTQQEFLRMVPYFREIDLEVLPLPDLEPETDPVHARRESANGPLRLVSWGGLVPGKGMATVVEACEMLQDPRRVSIDHFGRLLDESFGKELERKARRVRLTLNGPYDDGVAKKLFPTFDVAVFPSLFLETFGFAVDEAMRYGLPVLVSDRGAPRERIGRRGMVFTAGDAASLAALLRLLLDDPEVAGRMRRAPRPPNPTLSEHCDSLERIYRDARGGSQLRE